VRHLPERAYYLMCLALGRLLRSARYSKVRIVLQDGVTEVRKRRVFYAPLLVRLGESLMRILDTGVRVLPQRAWEERERLIYAGVHGIVLRAEGDRTIVLPYLAGKTLAALLEDPKLKEPVRKRAIELAVMSLADLHARGLTHGDAMAENVMIDLDAGVGRWFDFETVHDSSRPMAWRRADDVRALLATCLLRTVPEQLAETVGLILDRYPHRETARSLAPSFTSALRRPLTFHLGQAGMPYRYFQEIGRLLIERVGS
jgi:serine/threonine protein kinase